MLSSFLKMNSDRWLIQVLQAALGASELLHLLPWLSHGFVVLEKPAEPPELKHRALLHANPSFQPVDTMYHVTPKWAGKRLAMTFRSSYNTNLP